MAAKQLVFDENARRALERGANAVARAVKATLGPRGRNVVLDKKWGSPTITKDGVTVAKEIELEDPYENMGAQLVREVASKTNDVAGDGTTTATVLAQSIGNEGLRYVAAGGNPMAVRRGIDLAVEEAGEAIQALGIEGKGPGFGERRKAMLEDIATLTGGKFISEDLGVKLENIDLSFLGTAKKVVVSKDETTLIEGAGTHEVVTGRINLIRRQIEE